MITATINGESVDVEIIEADGRSGTALEQVEVDLITAIDDTLRAHPAFVATYPGARLARVDSNRMLQDTEEGRFYLRYRHDGGDTEFWGHKANAQGLDLERGVVSIEQSRSGSPRRP